MASVHSIPYNALRPSPNGLPFPPMFRRLFRLALCLAAALSIARAGDPHPSLPPPVIPDCLGVNIHFTDPKPGELEMLAAAGFKWVRMDFGWGGTERKKGEYDFSTYDRLVAALEQFQIRAVFILDYGNPLYADPGDTPPFTSRANSPEFREAFGKWAVAAVQHFKGRGYLWEMWNEPNGGFWKSPDKTGDYIALAKSTGEALRQAGLLGPKGEAFIGPATSEIDAPYLEACFKAGLLEYWDAVSVHPYRQGAPETVEEEYRSVRLLIRKYAPKDKTIPIISGEWGYSTGWKNFDDEKQARYLAREFLVNVANGIPLSIWYDWHDDGTNPQESEHRFGIVRNEYHAGRDPVYDAKPAYLVARALMSEPVAVLLQHGAFAASGAGEKAAAPLRGVVPITDWAGKLREVIADGDPKSASQQSLAAGAPPDGEGPAGQQSVKLTYKFSDGWKYLALPWRASIPALPADGADGKSLWPSGIGWWLHGDASGCATRLRFVDSSGQTFQADGPKIVWKGWRYIRLPLQPSDDAPLAHWGGANDGSIHYPIKWDSIFLLDNVSRQPAEGEIYLSAPTLIY